MSNLHALFALRNEKAFARALDASRTSNQANSQPSLSSSGGRSWTRGGTHIPTLDVNARDWLGRTVLHLACATPEPYALAYVRLLLVHPAINVNVQDTESRWTALHRALYVGNLAPVILLLQRPDTDTQLRDNDGYTPFDLYNSTVYGTSPDSKLRGSVGLRADLFTWGVNRNAALGHGDAADRAYPDQVVIQPPTPVSTASPARFTPIRVNGISMAKLHTTVITDETRGNLRVCGFGGGGRLGTGQHTQYSLQPVPQLTARIVAVSLGQDHTLALSATGEVLSWGLNRFAQLGYPVEREEPVQTVARRVLGPLRKEHVVGVAACRTASACWTELDVFTWGTNNGQLGYDHVAQPVQVQPRKVTGVQGVTELTLTDSAMACLLVTMDVICFRADAHFRVKFPAPELADLPPYQHPHVVKPVIKKITSTDGVFAALSSRGDIFTFAAPPPPSEAVPRPAIKPQRVWSLRKSFDPATDVALGADGALVICTASGHVFVRSRPGAKALRVPFVHRVITVCASSTGAFAALRLNPAPQPVVIVGPSLAEDLRAVRPWISGGDDVNTLTRNRRESIVKSDTAVPLAVPEGEEDDEGSTLDFDVASTRRLCALLSEKEAPTAYGANVLIYAGLSLPAHRTMLAARSPPLRALLTGRTKSIRDGTIKLMYSAKETGIPRVTVSNCQPITILLLLEYIYTDDVPALWDRRVGGPCGALLERVGVKPSVVKVELEALARALELPDLSAVLAAPTKRIPASTLARDMTRLFREPADVSAPDVMLELADRSVACHSVVLRARSQFFKSFFDDADWTARRWSPGGVLSVDMRHLEWRAMAYVVTWVYGGDEDGLFANLDDVDSVSGLLDLVFDVMAVASELLLDKLILTCSSVILRHVTLQNVAWLFAEATYFNALELVHSLQMYLTSNMEAILESHLLDDAQPDLIKALSTFIRAQQTIKAPATRTNLIIEASMRANSSWLELQDIPQPLVRSQRMLKESPRLSPVGLDKATKRQSVPTMAPLSSPITPKASSPKLPQTDDIFTMEDEVIEGIPALNIGQSRTPSSGYIVPPAAWKSPSVQTPARPMKAIIAEAETGKGTSVAPSGIVGARVVGFEAAEQLGTSTPKLIQKPSQRERRKLQAQTLDDPAEPVVRASALGSPWKVPTQQTSTSASPVSISAQRPPMTPHSSATSRMIPSQARSPEVNPGPSRRQPATPASILQASGSSLGPIVSPGSAPSALPRRTSGELPAWTKAPTNDLGQPPVSGLSFAAIQQQQRDQGLQPTSKQSLREIQQEEKARQEEEDFLKWWTAEEERLKIETETQGQFSSTTDASTSSQRGRGGRRPGRGSNRARRDVPARGRGKVPTGH